MSKDDVEKQLLEVYFAELVDVIKFMKEQPGVPPREYWVGYNIVLDVVEKIIDLANER